MKVNASDVLDALQEAIRQGKLEGPDMLQGLLGTLPVMEAGDRDAAAVLTIGDQRFRVTVTEMDPV
jgi:hypothetical protein